VVSTKVRTTAGTRSVKLRVFGTVALLLGSLPIQQIRAGAIGQRESADLLSQIEAEKRARTVSNVHYRIALDLTREEAFSGSVRIEFDYLRVGEPVTIDFSKGQLLSVEVNDHPYRPGYNGYFLTLEAARLVEGPNVVEIEFEHPYSDDGTGLYRFVDPADGRSYVYSYLWPYYANRVFPCFDQPDLKARYQISVKVEDDWFVVSTMREAWIESHKGEPPTKTWFFPDSKPLSTYVYSLHAGPYRVWESEAGDIPLRLLARQSLADQVQSDIWFDYTRRGFDFFQRYFDIPYPFYKYDQLIVPDFNIGAMENVAAVTFTEGYVWRGTPTRAQRESLAGVVLHEMAHMWFGNLVTKRWWNGLWLNESFATLMATLAKIEATEFEDAWHSFYLNSKRSAYFADAQVTTHPIEVPVPNTASFFNIFDSITYGKGASVLKQLAYLVGETEFREGVRRYLKQHAYGNTDIDDFVTAIGEASGRDLMRWSEEWLETAGTNVMSTRTECVGGRLAGIRVAQSVMSPWMTLREHRAEVALYSRSAGGRTVVASIEPMILKGASTDITPTGETPCPDFVFPNHDDWGYFRVVLEEQSLGVLEPSLTSLDDPLARSMFWGSLWDMMITGELSVPRLTRMLLESVADETDPRVLAQALDYLDGALSYLERRQPSSESQLRIYGPRIEQFLWSGVQAAAPGSDQQKIWFDHFVAAAQTPEGLMRLAGMLEGRGRPQGLDLDQDRRWQILIQLTSWDHPSARELRKIERGRDASYSGELWDLAVEASRPHMASKRKWISEFQDAGSGLSLGQQRQAMAALFPAHQIEFQTELVEETLDPLPDMSTNRDPYFLSSYGYGLLGISCSRQAIETITRILESTDRLDPTSNRVLLEMRQEAERCLRLDLN